jgi:hypothetical protein
MSQLLPRYHLITIKQIHEQRHVMTPFNISTFRSLARSSPHLVHLVNQRIDILLAIPQITTLNKVLELPRLPPAGRIAQLERPEELIRLLEVGAHGEDLVDEVLHAYDAVLLEAVLDEGVVGEGDALLVDLSVAALVNELADGLEVWVAVGDVGLDDLEEL